MHRHLHAFGYAALLVLLSAGTAAGAAGHDTIFSNDIAEGAVHSSDIKNSTIRAKDVKNGALTGRDIRDGTITLNDLDPDAIRELMARAAEGTPGGGTSGGGRTTPPPTDETPPPVPVAHKTGNLEKTAVIAWDPVTATDLAGYNLYRSSDAGATWQKVNTAIITSTSADGGNPSTGPNDLQTPQYAVTSIDATGNESARSNTVGFLCLATVGCT